MIRSYENKDHDEIENMLIKEGIPDKEQCFALDGFDTYILEDNNEIKGFFTIKHEKEGVSLQHLCIARQFRNVRNARELMRGVKETVKNMGHNHFIIHPEEDYLDKMAMYYLKKKPYAIIGRRSFYFVEV